MENGNWGRKKAKGGILRNYQALLGLLKNEALGQFNLEIGPFPEYYFDQAGTLNTLLRSRTDVSLGICLRKFGRDVMQVCQVRRSHLKNIENNKLSSGSYSCNSL